jgi:hypothetical protein
MMSATAKAPRAPKSDTVPWTFSEETFGFLWSEWDVDAAKAIIQAKPRKIERVAVSDLEPWLSKRTRTETGMSIRAGIVVDDGRVANDAKIDLSIPLIAVTLKQGGALPIDGWHRVARAVAQGVVDLPIVFLTKSESKSIEC